jgi:hypothetical protein
LKLPIWSSDKEAGLKPLKKRRDSVDLQGSDTEVIACDKCQKTFGDKNKLRKHQRVHKPKNLPSDQARPQDTEGSLLAAAQS